MMTLKTISRLEVASYAIILEDVQNGNEKTFVMKVDDGDIPVVVWHEDFAAFMRMNIGPAAPVLEAVLTFHLAQRAHLPEGR